MEQDTANDEAYINGSSVEYPSEAEEIVQDSEEIDLALLEHDWAPPVGWCEQSRWEPCPKDPRPDAVQSWLLHLWEHPHNSRAYLAFKNIQSRLCWPARSKKMSHPQLNTDGIELRDVIVEIPPPRPCLQKRGQINRRRGRGCFFVQNTPKRLETKLKADVDEPPYGWGLFFEESVVVPVFVKVFLLVLVVVLAVVLAGVCFALAKEHGYDVFDMGSFVIALVAIVFTVLLKFLG